MKLNNLKVPARGRKPRKRVGRGEGSGTGKTSGRGHKGQRSRSGSVIRPWFEGGQMPLQRRLPKRGFTNFSRVAFQVVNLDDLAKIKEDEVTKEVLKKYNLIRSVKGQAKLLGMGKVERAIKIKLNAISSSAKEKIEKAGGQVELVEK